MRKFWVKVRNKYSDDWVDVFVTANRFTYEDGVLTFYTEGVKAAAFTEWVYVVEDTSE